ncbi:MAG: hypothetical protein JSU69_11095, partial [Candidatus Zixiibacteriota bacterium]
MKAVALLLAVGLILFSFEVIEANTMRAGASPQIAPDTLEIGVPFTVDIYKDNTDGWVMGYSWPVCFYSPDQSITTAAHLKVEGGYSANIPETWPLVSLNDSSILMIDGYENYWTVWNIWYGFGWDGNLPDTLNHT